MGTNVKGKDMWTNYNHPMRCVVCDDKYQIVFGTVAQPCKGKPFGVKDTLSDFPAIGCLRDICPECKEMIYESDKITQYNESKLKVRQEESLVDQSFQEYI